MTNKRKQIEWKSVFFSSYQIAPRSLCSHFRPGLLSNRFRDSRKKISKRGRKKRRNSNSRIEILHGLYDFLQSVQPLMKFLVHFLWRSSQLCIEIRSIWTCFHCELDLERTESRYFEYRKEVREEEGVVRLKRLVFEKVQKIKAKKLDWKPYFQLSKEEC